MASKITQAFILGAGLGTRLRPITDTIPKVMVPIDDSGKPLLEHTIELLRDQGISDFLINVHYLPEVITSYFKDGKKMGVRITYSDESKELMETAGAIAKAALLLDENFLCVYGDHLHFFDFKRVIEVHMAKRPLATIVLKRTQFPLDADLVEFDADSQKITVWHARPHDQGELKGNLMANTGLYAFSKKILDYIPKGRPVKLDSFVLPAALAAGETLLAFPTNEPILDIGKPEKYEFAKEYYRKRKVAE